MSEIRKVPKTIQILTNLSCNLNCDYCYEKKNGRVNDIEDIKKYLDIKLYETRDSEEVILDFIGGESFLVLDLMEESIVHALSLARKYQIQNIIYSLTTNGTLLLNKDVQEFILKHKNNLYIGVSVDGIKEKHDKHRVFHDGSGSFDIVLAGLDWLKNTICRNKISIKATFAKEDIDMYYDCCMFLFTLGIRKITANFIFEGDYNDQEFYEKLAVSYMSLLEYLIDTDLIKQIDYEFFTANGDMIFPDLTPTRAKKKENWCGTCSHMSCLGFDGKVYGCNRFCTMDKPNMHIGVLDGDKILPTNQEFKDEVINQFKLYPEECIECPLFNVCSSCAALAYEEDDINIKRTLESKSYCAVTTAMYAALVYINEYIKEKNDKHNTD